MSLTLKDLKSTNFQTLLNTFRNPVQPVQDALLQIQELGSTNIAEGNYDTIVQPAGTVYNFGGDSDDDEPTDKNTATQDTSSNPISDSDPAPRTAA